MPLGGARDTGHLKRGQKEVGEAQRKKQEDVKDNFPLKFGLSQIRSAFFLLLEFTFLYHKSSTTVIQKV